MATESKESKVSGLADERLKSAMNDPRLTPQQKEAVMVFAESAAALDDGWKPGRWFRIFKPDGKLWMETSDGDEARYESVKTGWPLEREWVRTESEWRTVDTQAVKP